MEIKEIIEKCYEIYKPGMYFRNAYQKRFPVKFATSIIKIAHNITVNTNLGAQRFSKFTQNNEMNQKNQIAISNNSGSGGLVYCDGYWADICDKNGNVIKVIDGEKTSLDNIRDWLWK